MTLLPPLPLLPATLLRRHSCADPNDTRFRSVARLRQSLWREQHGYPCGRYVDGAGHSRRLGSMVSGRVGRQGINLVDPALVPLVQYEIPYRELGAVIYVDRLWNNLLTSQALVFNLFGPFKQNLALATAVMRRLAPDLVGEVTGVRFEHSPGRGQPRFTADHTAFDVLLHCTTPQGRNAFVAIEVKYSEAPAGLASTARPRYDALSREAGVFRDPDAPALRWPRYDALSREAGVFRDPDAPALRYAPIEQFWREQLLVTAMLNTGAHQDGRLLVIAPAANTDCQTAITRYRSELISDDPAETRFQVVTLDDFTTAFGSAGADALASGLTERCLDFEPVHRALAATFQAG
jgi:hypothetical protein